MKLFLACQFIFEQAVYYQLSDTALDNQLAKIEVGKNAVRNKHNKKKSKKKIRKNVNNFVFE